MRIIEKQMDLFCVSNQFALAHCISLDFVMGAGIAKAFTARFPKMKDSLLTFKSNHVLTCPTVLGYQDVDQLVFNLVTKEFYYQKPTYQTLQTALEQMAYLCQTRKIDKLAMPKIGCGLDRLEWEKVRELIENTFYSLDIEILICSP